MNKAVKQYEKILDKSDIGKLNNLGIVPEFAITHGDHSKPNSHVTYTGK